MRCSILGNVKITREIAFISANCTTPSSSIAAVPVEFIEKKHSVVTPGNNLFILVAG